MISLGVGDPDLPPRVAARDALAQAVRRDDVAHYPTNRGLAELRQAVARFYATRFGVDARPGDEIVPLLGAKEGSPTSHWRSSTRATSRWWPIRAIRCTSAARCWPARSPYGLPLLPELAFQPDLDAVPAAMRDRANLLIFGYPNNPTGAVVEDDFFARLVVATAIVVCHDNAYSDITFDGYVAPSFLATPGAREVGIEMLRSRRLQHDRLAHRVRRRQRGDGRRTCWRLKTNVDSGMFGALQRAAVALLDRTRRTRARAVPPSTHGAATWSATRSPRSGIEVSPPRGGMYVWLPVPDGREVAGFSERILDAGDVVVSPGVGLRTLRRGLRAARADPAGGPAGGGRASGS